MDDVCVCLSLGGWVIFTHESRNDGAMCFWTGWCCDGRCEGLLTFVSWHFLRCVCLVFTVISRARRKTERRSFNEDSQYCFWKCYFFTKYLSFPCLNRMVFGRSIQRDSIACLMGSTRLTSLQMLPIEGRSEIGDCGVSSRPRLIGLPVTKQSRYTLGI